MKIGDVSYKIDPYLVCDMPLLAEVLGLYRVHHPNSKFRCTHCLVQTTQLADWSIEEWSLRSIEDLKRLGAIADTKESDTARKFFAGSNGGVKVTIRARITIIILTFVRARQLHQFR